MFKNGITRMGGCTGRVPDICVVLRHSRPASSVCLRHCFTKLVTVLLTLLFGSIKLTKDQKQSDWVKSQVGTLRWKWLCKGVHRRLQTVGRCLGSQFHGSLSFPKVVGHPNLPLLIYKHVPIGICHVYKGSLDGCKRVRAELNVHPNHLCVAFGHVK